MWYIYIYIYIETWYVVHNEIIANGYMFYFEIIYLYTYTENRGRETNILIVMSQEHRKWLYSCLLVSLVFLFQNSNDCTNPRTFKLLYKAAQNMPVTINILLYTFNHLYFTYNKHLIKCKCYINNYNLLGKIEMKRVSTY